VSRLRLSLGCWNYDRTRGLLEGRIQPDGIELTYLNMPVEETFFRMLRHQEFDVAEMSLSSYTVSLFKENRTSSRSRYSPRVSSATRAST
jgi:4,5-dihydroxyphthalate decarboxylase